MAFVRLAYQLARSSARSSTVRLAVRGFSYPSHEIVGLPALSPTMESGVIASWNVEAGSTFDAGDVICEVETDKASVDFEAQDGGIVAKLLVDVGVDVKVGDPILVLVEDAADIPAFKDYEVSAASAPDAPAQAPAEKAPAAAPSPAPVPAPAPIAATKADPAPAPAPATPTPPAAKQPASATVMTFAAIFDKKKTAYHEKYGATGF